MERRETRQRAFTVAACAAAVAVGGPLIGHRFEVQKSAEAYRADAQELAVALNSADADWREVSTAEPEADTALVLAAFTNKADWTTPSDIAERLGQARDAASPVRSTVRYSSRDSLVLSAFAGLELVAGRARDTASLNAMGPFSGANLTKAEEAKTELDCLAEAIYYEARSENTRGQLAVAEVIMNRVRDSRFPNTICEVVNQGQYRQTGCQFTFTCDGSRRAKPHGVSWDRARAVALHVSLGLNKQVTNKATHYHTDYVNPYWKAGMVETNVIGTHIFYRFPKTGSEWATARMALDAQQQHRDALIAVEAEAPLGALDPAADVTASLITISTAPAVSTAEARPL